MIELPNKGVKMRAQWGVDVARRLNQLAPLSSPGVLARDGIGLGFGCTPQNRREKKPPKITTPFQVNWSPSSGKDGSWIIYLPLMQSLVSYGGQAATITDSLEPASSRYPDGWYILPDNILAAAGGQLCLSITLSDTPQATFGETTENSEDEVIKIVICEASYSADKKSHQVKQIVTSAIHLSVVPGEKAKIPMPFDVETSEKTDDATGKIVTSSAIVRCIFFFDGREQSLPDFAAPNDGTVYLVGECVTSESESDSPPEWGFRLDTNPAPESENSKVVNYKLYDFAGGKISLDYRAALVALSSGSSGGAIRLLGTEDNEDVGGVQIGDGEAKIIKFRSGSDSNVVVRVTGDGVTPGGNFESAIITIDVYYR